MTKLEQAARQALEALFVLFVWCLPIAILWYPIIEKITKWLKIWYEKLLSASLMVSMG